MDETTDKLLRDFLRDRRNDERREFEARLEQRRLYAEANNQVVAIVQSATAQLTDRFDAFERGQKEQLDRVEKKADSAHALALGANARLNALEEQKKAARARASNSIPPASPPVWDLGTESPTGSHYIIPMDSFKTSKEEWSVFLKENLDTHERLRDGESWRWLKENATKLVLAILGAVVAAVIIGNIVANAHPH